MVLKKIAFEKWHEILKILWCLTTFPECLNAFNIHNSVY